MPVDDVAESDSLVPVFPEIIPAYCAVPGFRRTGISPGPLIHPTAGICRDFVTFTCTYRILSGECALSRRRALRCSVACGSEVSSGLRELL